MRSDSDGVIVHFVHSLTGGGTERTLVSLLRSFKGRASRHIVVTQRDAGELATDLPDNVACYPLEVRGRSRWAWLRLARLMSRWNVKVLHARNTGCWMDAIMASLFTPRMQLLLGFHGLDTGAPFSRRQRRIARLGLWVGARFVSVSMGGQQQLEQQAGIPSDRTDVLPNGVDLARFQGIDPAGRRRTRSGWQVDDGTFVVGTVGSLTPVKRHDILIRAISEAGKIADNIKLVVVGDGPLRETLEDLAKTEHISDRVIFTGARQDIPDVLAGMDAYVCCSDSEGMNNALLEAMAAGLPVIATDVGDNALVVRNGIDGQVIPPCSGKSLVNALVSYRQESALRNRFATAARERVKAYSFDRSVVEYERYYRSASQRAVGGPATSGKGIPGVQHAARA